MSQPGQPFIIEELRPEDIEEMTMLRYQSFLDTYVDESLGITRGWLQNRNKAKMTPEYLRAWREQFEAGKANAISTAWVARREDGKMIGFATPFIEAGGIQRVGAIYVDKTWHGKGVGGALMKKVIDWHDSAKPIELHVAAYNERAKAFYRKWGFKEVPGSEQLFDDKIPEVKMIREIVE